MSSPELSVVCKTCGSEVSPYVTECPYCGTRLRKRAPKLERHGDELAPKETRRIRRERRRREAAERRASRALDFTRAPYLTLAAILGPAVLLLVQRATNLSAEEVGAIVGPVGSELWRYLAAPWVYTDVGYLFVISLALALLVPGLERRLGLPAAAILLVACGALGALAEDGFETAIGDGAILVAGANAVALGALATWFALRRSETRAAGEEIDPVAPAVGAAVLLVLPLVESFASFPAGVAGALVGLAAGSLAVRFG